MTRCPTPQEYSHRAGYGSTKPDAKATLLIVENATECAELVATVQDAVEAGQSVLIAARSAAALTYARSVVESVIALTPPAGQLSH